jgi:glycosyltransferase involved in cell wall biosynthesis
MKKILIVADEPGWIFERHALEIKKRLTKFHIDIAFRKMQITQMSEKYDLVYVMDPIPLRYGYPPPEKTLLGLRCEFLYEENPHGAKGLYWFGLPGRCVSIADKCKALHVVNRNQMRILKDIVTDKPLYLAQHGVDEDIFDCEKHPAKTTSYPIVVGTVGRRSQLKGFHFIEQACEKMGYRFYTAQYGKNKIPKEKMPLYYTNLDVYVCMSGSEGLNNGTLEAGAMGLPVISTRVGAAKEIIRDGENGFLINRDADSLVEALKKLNDNDLRLQMGKAMYEEIQKNWTWEKRIEDFRTMFEEIL